ncbi:hypothetical protein Syun_006787 [Stephania yunnanensis]|uniref:Uncharacterized protein n=1 Tax=Stephania yunnanensis TaxID=152371 RepID=A0AAP0KXG2_9MAGN
MSVQRKKYLKGSLGMKMKSTKSQLQQLAKPIPKSQLKHERGKKQSNLMRQNAPTLASGKDKNIVKAN